MHPNQSAIDLFKYYMQAVWNLLVTMPLCSPSAHSAILAALNAPDTLFHRSGIDDLGYNIDTPRSYWFVNGAHHPLSTGEDGCFRLILDNAISGSIVHRNVPCFEKGGAFHRVSTGCRSTIRIVVQLGDGNYVTRYGTMLQSSKVSMLKL
jgi:hypothetical protein